MTFKICVHSDDRRVLVSCGNHNTLYSAFGMHRVQHADIIVTRTLKSKDDNLHIASEAETEGLASRPASEFMSVAQFKPGWS